MRICIDARSFLERQPSGVTFFTHYLVHALVRTGVNHEFVFFLNSGSDLSPTLPLPKADNVTIIHRRFPNKILHLSFTCINRPDIRTFVGECDVYYFPNIHFLPRLPKKSVLTLHDISYLHTPDLYSFRSLLWYRLVRARTRISEASLCIVDSHATKMAVEEVFDENAPPLRVVYPAAPPVEPRERMPATHFLLLGDVDERKNIEGALRAYASVREKGLTELPMVVVGKRGYVYLHGQTLSLLRQLTARGWVREEGYVTEERKQELLAGAKALIFVSHYEGFGFPGLEAQKQSIPIIASNRTSLPEILGEGPVYVDPRNVSSIEEGFSAVCDDSFPKTYTYPNPLLSRTWDDVAKEMISLFNTIA